ncbi:MAG: hypothetical protein QG608_971 [Actinomycetota bacterium]|nr:hypothetical protein [Actinomycetota bacterium]
MDHRPVRDTPPLNGLGITHRGDSAGESQHTEQMPPERVKLLQEVERLRAEIARLRLSFPVPGADRAREQRDSVLERLDGYILPRLRRMDAPLLVVIGGSTGAGKSTLTNSIVGVSASPTGVLRPTTRSPVLVHNPQDTGAFMSRRILPDLTRTTQSGVESLDRSDGRTQAARSIRLVARSVVPPGLAVIDSPDLDSLVESNRDLARQLFGVADLWLFVTTGTDYADALPWELLMEATERKLSVAVVLDRMRESEISDIRVHFATMLRNRGLAAAPLFIIPEGRLVNGMLPEESISTLRGWLAQQGTDANTRQGHVSGALGGSLEHVLNRVPELLQSLAGQQEADERLRRALVTPFERAERALTTAIEDGSLLTDRLHGAWQRIAGHQEAPAGVSRLRWRMGAALRNAEARSEAANAFAERFQELARTELGRALGCVADSWRQDPVAGQLAEHPDLIALSGDLVPRITVLLKEWHAALFEGLYPQVQNPRGPVAADAVVLALAAVATGADRTWLGAVARQNYAAESPKADLRGRSEEAKIDLQHRAAALVAIERDRLMTLLDDGTSCDAGDAVRRAAQETRTAMGVLQNSAH